jgi:hypothetical protein
MPSLGDVVATTFVQELSGVQMANKLYWRVDDLGTNPTTGVALTQIMTEYHSVIKAALAPAWKLVCGIYENMTDVEAKAVVFTNLVGTSIDDSHPQDQVVRLNRYAVAQAPAVATLRVSGFHQSGVAEEFSTRGRVNDTAEFLALRNFLRIQQIFATEWTITPMSRNTEALGPPKVYQFNVVQQCLLNPTFLKLRSRKTNLCLSS